MKFFISLFDIFESLLFYNDMDFNVFYELFFIEGIEDFFFDILVLLKGRRECIFLLRIL